MPCIPPFHIKHCLEYILLEFAHLWPIKFIHACLPGELAFIQLVFTFDHKKLHKSDGTFESNNPSLLSLIIKGQDYLIGLLLDTLFTRIQSYYPCTVGCKHLAAHNVCWSFSVGFRDW